MAAHFRRRLQLLELIPRGRKVSASELRRRLEDRGFRVNLHTVQRDLAEFEQVRLIDGDGAKPEGWQWNRLLPPRQIPAMSPLTALALYLVAQAHVRRWPPVLGRQLQSQLAMAEQVLAGCDGGGEDWRQRIAVVPVGPERLPARVDDQVFAAVCEALLHRRQLQATCESARGGLRETRVLNPFGLVMRDEVVDLVALCEGGDQPCRFALPGMQAARVLDTPAQALPGFSLQDYLRREKTFPCPEGRQVRLVLRAAPILARQLHERPLAADQRIRPMDDGGFRVSARVALTDELRRWLRSWGRAVEVLRPADLRREFARECAELATRHAGAAAAR